MMSVGIEMQRAGVLEVGDGAGTGDRRRSPGCGMMVWGFVPYPGGEGLTDEAHSSSSRRFRSTHDLTHQ